MLRTAKETFVNSPHRVELEKIVQTAAFEEACNYALLFLLEEMPIAPTPAAGWDSHSQMVGARRVLEILSHLHEPIKKSERPKEPTIYRS